MDSNKKGCKSSESNDNKSQLLRIDQDSDDNFQALFDSVLNPGDSKRPLQVPLRMRKLPNSFFNPPLAGSKSLLVCHSRANSADSAFSTDSQTNINKSTQPQTAANNHTLLSVNHSRAHSSPASLQQTYTDVAKSTINKKSEDKVNNLLENDLNILHAVHTKQRSYDVASPIQIQNELGALPPGWEQAKTNDGQIYYLNHTTKTTQWEDPRAQMIKQHQVLQQPMQQSVNPKNFHKVQSSAEVLGSLPEGWEQALTDTGDVYFINHINRTTSWNDPRIPDFLQKPRSQTSWVNIRSLEKERDYFKQRQLDLLEQESLSRQSQQVVHLQMDPILSGLESHVRQESGDSGLSLSSNNFAVNAEFLPHVDDSMDCVTENENLHSLSSIECPDNLVSSLQLNETLCNEMLTEVHNMIHPASTKTESLEWYKIN